MKLEITVRARPDFLYMAPLLNVVLLLLIFFLLNSQLVVRSGIRVDLPVSNSSLKPLERSHEISITAGDTPQIFFNGQEVFAGDLEQRLVDARNESRVVIVHADAMAPHGVVQRVFNAAVRAGCDVAQATRLPGE